jgi:hypothetical protein
MPKRKPTRSKVYTIKIQVWRHSHSPRWKKSRIASEIVSNLQYEGFAARLIR